MLLAPLSHLHAFSFDGQVGRDVGFVMVVPCFLRPSHPTVSALQGLTLGWSLTLATAGG